MAGWEQVPASREVSKLVAETARGKGHEVYGIHIERRHRDKLCFVVRHSCGAECTVDLDLCDDAAALAGRVAWMIDVSVKRSCLMGRCAPPAAPAPPPPAPRMIPATAAQLRELASDPFIRAFLDGFDAGLGDRGRVAGARFPDGATFRSGEPQAVHEAPAEWRDSTYAGGKLPPAARAGKFKR